MMVDEFACHENEGFRSPSAEEDGRLPVFVSPHSDEHGVEIVNPKFSLKRKRTVSNVDIYLSIYPCKQVCRGIDEFNVEEDVFSRENDASQLSDSCNVSQCTASDVDSDEASGGRVDDDRSDDESSCCTNKPLSDTDENSDTEKNYDNDTIYSEESMTSTMEAYDIADNSSYTDDDDSDSCSISSATSFLSEGLLPGGKGCIVVRASDMDEPSSVSGNDHEDSSSESDESSLSTTSICGNNSESEKESEEESSESPSEEDDFEDEDTSSGSEVSSTYGDIDSCSDANDAELEQQALNKSPLPQEVSVPANVESLYDDEDKELRDLGDVPQLQQCDLSLEELDDIMSASQMHSSSFDADLEFSDDEDDQA